MMYLCRVPDNGLISVWPIETNETLFPGTDKFDKRYKLVERQERAWRFGKSHNPVLGGPGTAAIGKTEERARRLALDLSQKHG